MSSSASTIPEQGRLSCECRHYRSSVQQNVLIEEARSAHEHLPPVVANLLTLLGWQSITQYLLLIAPSSLGAWLLFLRIAVSLRVVLITSTANHCAYDWQESAGPLWCLHGEKHVQMFCSGMGLSEDRRLRGWVPVEGVKVGWRFLITIKEGGTSSTILKNQGLSEYLFQFGCAISSCETIMTSHFVCLFAQLVIFVVCLFSKLVN